MCGMLCYGFFSLWHAIEPGGRVIESADTAHMSTLADRWYASGLLSSLHHSLFPGSGRTSPDTVTSHVCSAHTSLPSSTGRAADKDSVLSVQG